MNERKGTQKSLTKEEIEERIAERAEAVRQKVQQLEKSSRLSASGLWFDSPGGQTWLRNHPNH